MVSDVSGMLVFMDGSAASLGLNLFGALFVPVVTVVVWSVGIGSWSAADILGVVSVVAVVVCDVLAESPCTDDAEVVPSVGVLSLICVDIVDPVVCSVVLGVVWIATAVWGLDGNTTVMFEGCRYAVVYRALAASKAGVGDSPAVGHASGSVCYRLAVDVSGSGVVVVLVMATMFVSDSRYFVDAEWSPVECEAMLARLWLRRFLCLRGATCLFDFVLFVLMAFRIVFRFVSCVWSLSLFVRGCGDVFDFKPVRFP